MSDDTQQPNKELEAALLLEQAEQLIAGTEGHKEPLETEVAITADADEHGQFDDAADDFAYEAAGDEDEVGDDDAAESDIKAEDECDDVDSEVDSAPYDGDAGEDLFDGDGDEELSDGDNDPAPQARPKDRKSVV